MLWKLRQGQERARNCTRMNTKSEARRQCKSETMNTRSNDMLWSKRNWKKNQNTYLTSPTQNKPWIWTGPWSNRLRFSFGISTPINNMHNEVKLTQTQTQWGSNGELWGVNRHISLHVVTCIPESNRGMKNPNQPLPIWTVTTEPAKKLETEKPD